MFVIALFVIEKNFEKLNIQPLKCIEIILRSNQNLIFEDYVMVCEIDINTLKY